MPEMLESVTAQAGKPLAGLRVVDFSDTLPGVQATQFFADNGAEVIHVERPGGCSLRRHPAFPALGRGKKSIQLDLKAREDAKIAFDLASSADVVIEAWRPGVADRLGLGYDALSATNHGLVHTSISGWGDQGPYVNVKGYEALVAARFGAFDSVQRLTTRPGPSFISTNIASYGAMQSALLGTLAALLERETSGCGQRVATDLVKGMASLDVWNWALRLIGERYPDAFTNTSTYSARLVPQSPTFFKLLSCLSRDGRWQQFAQVQPRLFRAFMRAVELDWMFDDPNWSTVPDFEDEAKRVEFWEMLLAKTRLKSLADWQAIYDADNNVFGEVYRRGAELLDHPQLIHNGQVAVIHDPVHGPVRQPAPLVRLLDNPIQLDAPAPALDAHGAALRAEPGRPSPPMRRAGDAPHGKLPLEGVTVLEMAFFFAAPYAATLLTDLGARVLKIEPLEGDPIRTQLGFPEVSGMHVFQGKECIALDIKTPAGQEIVRRLAARADIYLTSFRPGAMDRLGIGPTALRAVNPNLVVMNAMGYGIDGPYADKPAFAPSISAGSGISLRNLGPGLQSSPDMSIELEKTESVRLNSAAPGLANPDGFSSTAAASAMLLGLLARARTGKSPRMLTSMMGTSAHVLADQMLDYRAMTALPGPDEELHGLSARYRLYETAEGWVFLAAPDEAQWETLARALAPAPIASDPRFVDAGRRAANDAELAVELARAFRERTAREWEAALLAVDVGCVALPGRETEYVYQGSLGRESGCLAEAYHPMIGDYERSAPSISFSRSRTQALGGCMVGAHTRDVLRELGYDDRAIDEMERQGAVGLG